MIAVGGSASAPIILDRRRIELIEGEIPKQPYHASEALDLGRAEKIIGKSLETATRLARNAIEEILENLNKRGYRAISSGLLLASGRALPALANILASHALIHAAEGELFRDAIATACGACKLSVVRAKEQELATLASDRLAISGENLPRKLQELGRPMGSPWGQDQKCAALVAWVALNEYEQGLHGAQPKSPALLRLG